MRKLRKAKKVNIYEIDQRLLELVDPETGELLDEEAFASLQMERDAKIENLILWYKNTTAEAAAVKAEADALAKRAAALKARAERLKSRVDYLLQGEKFQTARCTASYRASTSVELLDESALAAWAVETNHEGCIVPRPPAVDKMAVKALLKSGEDVPGAQLVKKNNLVVS